MDALIPNGSVFIQIANFLILLFILNIILYKPIRGIIKKRNEEMASTKNMTEDLLQRAEKYSEEYNENLNSTRKEGMHEKEGLKNVALKEEKDMLQKAYSSVEEKLNNAREEIKETLAKAKQDLQAEVEDFSQELVKKVLGRSV